LRIGVIGAGIVGVTTAYELACDGHAVSVFERCGSVAAETSFANAGLVAPGYVTPWAAPGMPGKVLRELFSRHAAVRINPRLDARAIRWMWQWWRACGARGQPAKRGHMQRLALFSKARLNDTVRRLQLDYERSDGTLVLLRTPKDLALAQPRLASLTELGIKFKLLDAHQCALVEPGLSIETALHAGVYLPDDEVGNCRQFAHLLRNEAQSLGASFRFHADVRQIVPGAQPQIVHMYAPPEESSLPNSNDDPAVRDAGPTQPMPFEPATESFDAIVVCAALGSLPLLSRHGLKLPLAAVHGYSVTAPMRRDEHHPDRGPRSAVMDEHFKVAVSRLGSRVRVAGSAEIGGNLRQHNKAALETLYKVLHDWFPGVARMSHAQLWKGARPMLPDGPPLLGKSGLEGIWLNLGHGSSGWALSCGSARVVADLVAGRQPAIDVDGLGIERLHH
jgi:D-amino-acid dehydrogenase